MKATARATQPSPQASENIAITPPAGRLTLSSRHPKREHPDKEREAQMNREAVDRWKARQYDKKRPNTINPRVCYTIEADNDVLHMLIDTGQIGDGEMVDARRVGEVISHMLADAAAAWKAEH
jgi:hypothetical protein